MIWDKLVDRCLLFTDAPGGLLKALLKEAEIELSNRLELYDAIYTITVPSTNQGLGLETNTASDTADHNYTRLPMNYLKDIAVKHQGFNLKKISEENIYRQEDGTIPSGNPTAYCIAGDYIVFDKTPSSGDKFYLYYKAALDDDETKDKVLTVHKYFDTSTDLITLGTNLGAALNGKTFQLETNQIVLANGTIQGFINVGHNPSPDIVNRSNNSFDSTSQYEVSSGGAGTGSGTPLSNWNGAMGRILDYRSVAPVIPDRYHTSLCNYAIAIANAKTSPDLYDKYYTAWELNMERLINEAQDRDLIFSIREEI